MLESLVITRMKHLTFTFIFTFILYSIQGKINVFLFGDYAFICMMYGLSGASGKIVIILFTNLALFIPL